MAEMVLIVDDEKEIADLIEVYLKNEGYAVVTRYDTKTALEYLASATPDAALFDVMLPGIDGFELCRRVRQEKLFPIIMLTARVSDLDKISGLTLGADDYVAKPFNPLEVVARVKTQLRRCKRYNEPAPTPEEYDMRGLYLSVAAHRCTLYGEPVALTPTEFRLLCCLCRSAGRVVSSEALFEEVWEEKYFDANNTVMTHIARLREKLHEPARRPKFIRTVWGVGYTIDE